MSIFHMNASTRTETFALLVNCVSDDALLKTMPDIGQVLLPFINVMNLVDPLLHFQHTLQSISSDLSCWVAKGLMKCTFQKVDCLVRLVNRHIALLKNKELATVLLNQKHLTVV